MNSIPSFPIPNRPQRVGYYKYIRKEHLEMFYADGTLRIGTLFDFKKEHQHGVVVGDQGEGTMTTLAETDSSTVLADDTPTSNLLRRFFKEDATSRISFGNCKFSFIDQSPDVFLYSVSTVRDPDLMTWFGYDGCFRIVNPWAFFNAITNQITKEALFTDFAAIEYEERELHCSIPRKVHPWLLKDPSHQSGQEWRALWTPRILPIAPLIVKVPNARRHCEIIEF